MAEGSLGTERERLFSQMRSVFMLLKPWPQTLLVIVVWVKGLIGDFVALNSL